MLDVVCLYRWQDDRWMGPAVDPLFIERHLVQVVPWLFEHDFQEGVPSWLSELRVFCEKARCRQAFPPSEYFSFCFLAHQASLDSSISTDLDLHIRRKLWASASSEDVERQILWLLSLNPKKLEPGDVVLATGSPLGVVATSFTTSRASVSTMNHLFISGHSGEWISVLAVAWSCIYRQHRSSFLEKYLDPLRDVILDRIEAEVRAFDLAFRHDPGKTNAGGERLLELAFLIAHNMGDLQRVLSEWGTQEMFSIPLTKLEKAWDQISVLNRDFMAPENPRHYELRKVRWLQSSQEYLIPFGPFFYPWAQRVLRVQKMRTPDLSLREREVAQWIEALLAGHEKNSSSQVYIRALKGIIDTYPGGEKAVLDLLPRNQVRKFETVVDRSLLQMREEAFREKLLSRVRKALM